MTTPANGSFVNNSRPAISGSADANATVNIYLDGNLSGSALASSAGAWSFTPTDPLADGTHTVSATETDSEGHTVATSNTNNFTVDSTAPTAPVVSAPSSGAYVNNTQPYISGTAEANARVTIYLDGGQAGTVTANGSGAWGFVPAIPLADGPHTLKAAATDRAGNTGVSSSDIAFRSSSITSGTPGNLDTGFGSGGIVTTAIGSGDDTASGVAVQIDGKIVVVGTSYNGSNKDFAVVRYNTDGTLDTTFNGTGKVTTDFRGHDDFCSGVVLQDDGKIVVVGYSSNGTRNDFSLARYNTNGTLDTSFGQLGTGKVVTTGICTNSEAYAVSLQPDGKFVMVGRVQVGYWQPAVVRYHPDGAIDNDFGSGGLWHYPLSLYNEYNDGCAFGVAVQGDGTIVVTGQSTGWGYYSYDCTFRMDTDGKLIGTGFGGVVGPISSIVSNAVAMQADGKILTADSDFRLMRFLSDGSLDTSFGGNGVVNTGIGVGSNVAKGLVLQGDGRIVAAGFTYNANTGVNDFALVRYNTDGTPDTGFHGTGIVTTHIGAGDSYGQSVALQVDGRILVAGNSISGGKSRFTVVRYYGTDQPPIVQTGVATVVTKTSATLNGTVNPNSLETTAYFEYGLDANYGNRTGDQTCGYGLNAVSRSSSIRDLTPNTVYHFRLVARNSAALFGGVTYGKDATFTTEPDPPVDVTAAAIGVGSSGATLAAVVFPNGRETSVYFEYGLTTAYDNSTAVQIIPAGTGAVNVFATVAGLVPGGTYHFRVVATNSGTPVPIPGLDQSFVANDPPPTVSTGAASQLTTTSARVNGTVRTHNAASQVFFEYGTDGVTFPSSVAATPSTVTGDVDTPVSADLANLAQTVTYYYRVRAVSNGGTSYGQIGSFKLNILSGLIQGFPGAPPDAEGYVFVTLIPSGINSGWRFVGEQQWRPSVLPVGGLTTGDRQIEFRPVPGYIQPLQESISVISGGLATLVTGEYYPTPGIATGEMSVVLKPDALADVGLPVDQRAQWRFLGEDDTHWRNSGVTVSELPAGDYLVESKPITGRTTPAVINVSVDSGATKVATATYFLAGATTGTVPSVVSFDTVSTNQTLPYAYVGQIRSDLGSASGFVVKPRVVATAAHVAFDDGTLSYVSSLQWLFQRDRGTYEPTPQIPRGFYVFDGYASQRTAEATPGVSTPQSQNLDTAALYFLEDAGRGGYGGWLASDLDNNEFLLSTKMKLLVGYPVDGIATLKQGRMHATPVANIAFTKAFGRTFTTADIRGAGGNSGGPLCVQADNGNYYPAAIYLGGSGQTVVRAIDSQVIDLFNRAEVSANGGDDNLGGGIITIRPPVIAPPPAPASLKVIIAPAGAIAAGARWNVGGAACASGASISLPAGTYTLTCTGASGFLAPASSTITLSSGQGASVGRTYSGITAHPAGLTVAAGGNATFSIGVSGTPTSYQWRRNGTNIPGATSATYTRTNLTATDTGNYSVVVTWGGSGSLTSNAAALDVTATAGFEVWRALNFTATELLDALKSGPTADYDHDGVCNLLEYALNLDTKTADVSTMIAGTGTGGLPLVRVENVGGQNRLTVEHVRRKAASTPGITYAVEFSSNLSNSWSATGTETVTSIDTTWERVKTTDQQSSSPSRFTRLKVTQP
ncbi:MAG: Ig-like domain-containing protein [Verrucomicrobiota bacterium]